MSDGLIIITPTSIASTGTGNSSSIGANGKVTFSSCATLSLNGVFTSTYDNYVVSIRHFSGTDGSAMYLRLRSSGTDATTGYTWQYLYASGTSVTAARNSVEGYARIGMLSATQRSGDTVFIYGPFLSQPTAFRNVNAAGYSSGTVIDYASTHSTSSSYDGITITPSAGSTTGTVTVYGFKQ